VSERQALRLHPRDDVAVALQALRAGRECSVAGAGEAQSLTVAENVPACHKIALRDMPAGTVVHKYGEAIGVAMTAIRRGSHVHIHNLASRRARG
jgi:altronate dehydratase